MPRRLTSLTVDWGSLVDAGANKGATVALFKRDDTIEKRIVERDGQFCVVSQDGSKTFGCHKTRGEALAQLRAIESNKSEKESAMDEKTMKALLESLPEKNRAEVEKALSTLTKSVADEKATRDKAEKESGEKVAALEKRATELDAKVAELSKKEEKPEDVLKSLPEEIRKRIEDAEKRAPDAEKIAKEERSARELSEITKRVEAEMPQIDGTAAEKAALLQRVRAVVTKEDADRLDSMLKAASTAIEKGALFAEIGGSAPVGSAASKLEAIAEDLRKADPNLSKAVAMAKAAKQHPDLRREQLAEQRTH